MISLVRDALSAQIDALLRKSQEELGADILGFGRVAARNFSTIAQWEKYGWQDQYPYASISAQVVLN